MKPACYRVFSMVLPPATSPPATSGTRPRSSAFGHRNLLASRRPLTTRTTRRWLPWPGQPPSPFPGQGSTSGRADLISSPGLRHPGQGKTDDQGFREECVYGEAGIDVRIRQGRRVGWFCTEGVFKTRAGLARSHFQLSTQPSAFSKRAFSTGQSGMS